MTTAKSSIATIDQFVKSVGQIKTASEKAADGTTPLSEPGSIGGETSHPVKRVDDRLDKAKTGKRSEENSKDVKADQGPASVEGRPEASTKSASIFGALSSFAKSAEGGAVSQPGSAEDDHISTTTKVAPTGEDPAHETNSAKAGKEDKEQGGMGGTSHPANTENDSLDGHKYANDNLEKLASDMRNMGNTLLAQIHDIYTSQGLRAPAAATKQASYGQQNQIDPQLAYYAGNELAGLISGKGLNKQAVDTMVHSALTEVIKTAADDADAFIQYATAFTKRALEEAEPPMGGGMPPGGDPSMGGGMPPGGGGGMPPVGDGGGAEGGDDHAMLAALGGGADAGGGDMGGAEGGQDAEVMQLASALEEMGVTPEELEAAMQEHAAGGGAGGGDAGAREADQRGISNRLEGIREGQEHCEAGGGSEAVEVCRVDGRA